MRQAAFLRSINVGGRRVKNTELVAVFEGMGLADVAAYQAAGNLVFRGDADARSLEQGLSAGLGFDVPVILRTLDELVTIARSEPFTAAERDASGGKIQVLLLRAAPSADVVAEILALETGEDRLRLDGRELFWLPMGRTTDSTLDLARIGRLVGLQTGRTHGTLQRMAKKFA